MDQELVCLDGGIAQIDQLKILNGAMNKAGMVQEREMDSWSVTATLHPHCSLDLVNASIVVSGAAHAADLLSTMSKGTNSCFSSAHHLHDWRLEGQSQ